jgi:tRNA threonylcarbamoyladenosine biosynthesis protein TsaB
MLILAVDTSGKNGSLAVVRFEEGHSYTVASAPLEGGTFSAQLIPQISELLAKHKLTKEDIDALAVVSGPGSFTGLRVGLAAIKALAEILKKPIAAVSLLESIAVSAGCEGRMLAVLDAGRGEIYCGEYEVAGSLAKLIEQRLLTAAEFADAAAHKQVVTPDTKIAELAGLYHLSVTQIGPPNAEAVARIGFQKIEQSETVSPEALDANYIRRSDAEIMKSARS